jgi:hypothetical protein
MTPQIKEGTVIFNLPTLPPLHRYGIEFTAILTLVNPSLVPLVVLHGGPGVPQNYLLPLTDLANEDAVAASGKPAMPVVLYVV